MDPEEELFKRDPEVVRALLKQWDDTKPQPPLFMTLAESVQFGERIQQTLHDIAETRNPRLVVLETWLIIDFVVRRLLVYGLELDRFVDEKFTLVPESFDRCLKLLKKLKKVQEAKPLHPQRFHIHLYCNGSRLL